MDWGAAVERNRESLKRILATLVAMAGLADGATTMPRRLHQAVLRVLRPAEAAVRRLIIVVAQGLVVTLLPQRQRTTKPRSIFVKNGGGTGIILPPGMRPGDLASSAAQASPNAGTLSFPLLDPLRFPRKRQPTAQGVPRICLPGVTVPFPVAVRRPPAPDDPIDVKRLTSRLRLLGHVLDDLPGQARRFARWLARRNARRTSRLWPLRPGRPPGGRRRSTHEVDDVLAATHGLAFDALERRDTS